MATEQQYTSFIAFRQAAYECLGPARDALFELCDAIMLTPSAQSFAELSLCPAFRRRWPSVYEALQDGRPDRRALLSLYVAQMPPLDRPLLVGDHTPWPRLSASTLRDRTFEHHPTKIRGNKPITVGHGYSTIAWRPPDEGHWVVPLLHERMPSGTTPVAHAAAQLRQVAAQLEERSLSLWDSEYGCAAFVKATADIPADTLMRVRPNRCLYGPPPPYRGWGRPPVHGAKFKLADPSTWPEPVETLQTTDPKWGAVTIQRWDHLHFKEAAQHRLVLLRLHRLEAKDTRRDPKDVWLAWAGEPPPPLEQWWHLYGRRVAIEPWYHLAKSRLHWTLPRLKTPEQSQCWSDLMPLVSWFLWLARPVVADTPLPWQKPQPQPTPQRVLQGMGGLLTQIGTPTRRPKPRGKSPGWPPGRLRRRATRYRVVKKSA
jgi:hypothetical protein